MLLTVVHSLATFHTNVIKFVSEVYNWNFKLLRTKCAFGFLKLNYLGFTSLFARSGVYHICRLFYVVTE